MVQPHAVILSNWRRCSHHDVIFYQTGLQETVATSYECQKGRTWLRSTGQHL